MLNDRTIVDQAIDWQLRQRELTAAGWHDFVAWLEADPAHATAFDHVALDNALLGEVVMPIELPVAANDHHPVPSGGGNRRWLWAVGGSAVAAGLAVLAMPIATSVAGDPYSVSTRPGEQRTVTLADGTRIELGGGTTLRLDRKDLRVAQLDAGEAMFAVRHDAGKPFTVRSGELTVQDVGTVFDVARQGRRLDVQVAEGAVMFQPGREALLLKAGAGLSASEETGTVTMTKVAPDSVGSWREGRLTFSGEPLGTVISAVHRASGADLTLDPGLSAQPFTGMVRVTGKADQDVPHLAALIGARWRRDGERWILSPTDAKQN